MGWLFFPCYSFSEPIALPTRFSVNSFMYFRGYFSAVNVLFHFASSWPRDSSETTRVRGNHIPQNLDSSEAFQNLTPNTLRELIANLRFQRFSPLSIGREKMKRLPFLFPNLTVLISDCVQLCFSSVTQTAVL